MGASISMRHPGLAAALAAGAVLGASAQAQSRIPGVETGAPTLVIGITDARQCYEFARDQNGSDAALETCDFALASSRLVRRDQGATLVNRSIIRTNRGELDAALADLDAAAALLPDSAAVHINLGDVYSRLGRWADAEAAFSRAIELGLEQPQRAYFARAIAREETGDLRGAYDDYTRAAELAPDWLYPKRELERFVVGSAPAS